MDEKYLRTREATASLVQMHTQKAESLSSGIRFRG